MNSLLPQLQHDFPAWTFQPGEHFAWSAQEQVIYYIAGDEPAYLLHEIAHARLDHANFERDIDLLKMERDAWDTAARDLAPAYGVAIDDELIQINLDTYRDWLHARSLCPGCMATGYQTARRTYACPACQSNWRVNEARTCGLKRYRF